MIYSTDSFILVTEYNIVHILKYHISSSPLSPRLNVQRHLSHEENSINKYKNKDKYTLIFQNVVVIELIYTPTVLM